ncbi:hypothetical protein GQX73_g4650 [Xylaria multiplex]|uniref:Uncharacterized protein n=1 Tax=Xylaria multiplex TaxID=323545 RepID=A0A7C8IPH1_9PEZI|nr:hypothetical protein GQX73_g4650 [Xylaria multiplex]
MPLPTGAVIAGFVASVLSWYGLIRNGVQLVYDDYKTMKSFDQSIDDLIMDMGQHQTEVENWKSMWMIPDHREDIKRGGPHEMHPFESLYDMFWGEEKPQVLKRMQLLRDKMSDANNQLKSFTSLTKEKWQKRRWLKKKLLIISFIMMKKKYLMTLRDDIARLIKNVQDDAKHAWRGKRKKEIDEPVNVDDVRHEGICHLLVPLAITTWQGLDGMREICQGIGESYRTELELDIFSSSNTSTMIDRSRTILSAAEIKRVTLHILSQRTDLPLESGHMSSSYVEKLEAEAQSGLSGHDAFLHVLKGNGNSDFVTTENVHFSIKRPDNSHEHTREPNRGPNTKRTCFCTPSVSGNIEIVQLKLRSQRRAAYELAQACLLFLNTAWFSNICSCELRCGVLQTNASITRSEYEFALRIGIVNPHDRHPGDVDDACQHKNPLTRSLRRLGLMLIELNLRAKISSITCKSHKVVSFSANLVDGSIKNYNLEEFLKDPSLPQRYRDALEYCITAEFPDSILTSREGLENYLAGFYKQVLQPYVRHQTLSGAARTKAL